MDVKGRKVFVGLSGGVDSAVTAALLKEAGANVTGVFIKGWYPPELPCTWSEDRRDAMRVAAHLGIPFHTLNASAEYKRDVIDYLVREYGAGRTPNPDVFCNRSVKFGAFYHYAMKHGVDFIATGHYARAENGTVFRGSDPTKDQSYFLWAVPVEVFAHVLFPLGDMKKSEVRTIAKKFQLPNAAKPDSQGICFLGNVSMKDFLKQDLKLKPGKAYDKSGIEVGVHEGALAYTLGERIGLVDAKSGPWYVLGKDQAKNTLTVGHEPETGSADSAPEIRLSDVNWLQPRSQESLTAQYRYHGPRIQGALAKDDSSFTPDGPIPELLASGQSLVVYAGEKLIGGGIIES